MSSHHSPADRPTPSLASVMIDSSPVGYQAVPSALSFCSPPTSLLPPPMGSHLIHRHGHDPPPHILRQSPVSSAPCIDSVFASAFIGGFGLTAPDSSAFYAPSHVDSAVEGWHNHSAAAAAAAAASLNGIGGGTGGWTFDPRHMPGYGYGSVSYGLDVRRKNATRESTSTLKAWLFEHIKNPYPTKGEKIMLAIITKMTLTQVSTWFANARRRLKKENKMQWPPRQRPGDDDDDDGNSMSDENDDVGDMSDKDGFQHDGHRTTISEEKDIVVDTDFDDNSQSGSPPICVSSPPPILDKEVTDRDTDSSHGPLQDFSILPVYSCPASTTAAVPLIKGPAASTNPPSSSSPSTATTSKERSNDNENIRVKPRIWSLVDVATSSSDSASGQMTKELGTRAELARHLGHIFPFRRSGNFQPWMTSQDVLSYGINPSVVYQHMAQTIPTSPSSVSFHCFNAAGMSIHRRINGQLMMGVNAEMKYHNATP